MALIKPEILNIEVEVSDKVFNDTTIKQKVVFDKLVHEPRRKYAGIFVSVKMYAKDGDGYGEPLNGKGFYDNSVELIADNNTIVDAATGEILRVNTDYLTVEEFEALADAYEQPVMLQGDFFEVIRDSQSIVIGDMIRQHIAQADAMGKFN